MLMLSVDTGQEHRSNLSEHSANLRKRTFVLSSSTNATPEYFHALYPKQCSTLPTVFFIVIS